jgi:hypothetical protein
MQKRFYLQALVFPCYLQLEADYSFPSEFVLSPTPSLCLEPLYSSLTLQVSTASYIVNILLLLFLLL